MTEKDEPALKAEITRVCIERKRLNPQTGELEPMEPIIIETERDDGTD